MEIALLFLVTGDQLPHSDVFFGGLTHLPGQLCADLLKTSKLPPPLPGKARAFELLMIGSFTFPPPGAKIVFKCPTQSSNWSERFLALK